jgi:hypothetical protein
MKLRLTFTAIVLLVCALQVHAAPQLLTDAELDRVTAKGTDIEFTFNPESGGLNFGFNTGSTVGNGSVVSSPLPGSSNLNTLTGTNTLSNNTFVVENMIMNVNICAMCNATVINQIGLGLGVTVNPITPEAAP